MSGLLLCSSKRGEKPYMIRENGGEIWSLEELCYYLYQNACRITEEFFTDELMSYLAEELKVGALAEQLTSLKNDGRDFVELIMAVCEAANYYSREELNDLRERLRKFASLGKAERLKQLADSSMQQKRYAQALKEYEAVLALRKREQCGEILIGRIYHNMGVAYGKMLLYHEAEDYLKRAMAIFSEAEEYAQLLGQIKKELLLVYYLADNTKQTENVDMTEEEKSAAIAEWEEIRSSARVEAGRSEAVIEKWKQEYRAQMS